VHDDEYFNYLLRDPDYLGEEMFIVRIGMCEVGLNNDQNVIRAYNIMHVGHKMQVEWGVGSLKRKWKWLMKKFDSTKPKYTHLFKATIILTNFLHRDQMDFTFEVISE